MMKNRFYSESVQNFSYLRKQKCLNWKLTGSKVVVNRHCFVVATVSVIHLCIIKRTKK
jgi:hypothetical protein